MKADHYSRIKLAAESILRSAEDPATGKAGVSAGTAKGALLGGVLSLGLVIAGLIITTATFSLGIYLLAGAVGVLGGAYTGAVLGSQSVPEAISDSLPEPDGESQLGLEALECAVLHGDPNTTRSFRDRVATSSRSADQPGAILARR